MEKNARPNDIIQNPVDTASVAALAPEAQFAEAIADAKRAAEEALRREFMSITGIEVLTDKHRKRWHNIFGNAAAICGSLDEALRSDGAIRLRVLDRLASAMKSTRHEHELLRNSAAALQVLDAYVDVHSDPNKAELYKNHYQVAHALCDNLDEARKIIFDHLCHMIKKSAAEKLNRYLPSAVKEVQ